MLSLIPYRTLDRLRCDSCNCFLSCNPITSDGQRVFCGRCMRLTYTLYLYEKVAGYFMFPCRYWSKHCTSGAKFNDITRHETSCIRRNGCINFCTNPISVCQSNRQMSKTPCKLNAIIFALYMNRECNLFCVAAKFDLGKIKPEILNALGKCHSCNGSITSSPIYSNKDHVLCYRCSYENIENYNRELPLETLFLAFLFPCNFKEWGCAEYHRFGKENEIHEQQCLYRPNPNRKQRQSSSGKADADGKIRGIIQNHRGAMWGTISPNHQVFVKETETSKRANDGLMVPTRKNETIEQAMFHNDLRYQQQRIHRRESDRSQMSNKPHSILRNNYVPDVHRPVNKDSRYDSDTHYNDGSQISDTSYNDRMMTEMRESLRSDNYPSQLAVPKPKPIDKHDPNKKGAIIRAGSYYDTNYNKVLQEFNYRKKRSKDVNN